MGSGTQARFINFYIAFAAQTSNLSRSIYTLEKDLNAELAKKALEKVGNPNVLVNLISRRVRQLNAGSGALSRPLVADTANLGAADIALLEIIEDKVGFEMPEITELTRPVGKKRKKH
jgi:DNA-directed RNA polymerase subunit omega